MEGGQRNGRWSSACESPISVRGLVRVKVMEMEMSERALLTMTVCLFIGFQISLSTYFFITKVCYRFATESVTIS